MDTVQLHGMAKDWFFSQIKDKKACDVWPTMTTMLTQFGEYLLKQCSVSGALLPAVPVRIQRSRQHKQTSPNGLPVVYVGRPTKWGNPFRPVKEDGLWWIKDNEGNYWDASHSEKYSAISVCIRLYEAWIEGKIGIKEVDLNDLKGKNLSCWCPKTCKCHADVLLELANS